MKTSVALQNAFNTAQTGKAKTQPKFKGFLLPNNQKNRCECCQQLLRSLKNNNLCTDIVANFIEEFPHLHQPGEFDART